jgi:tetratricopeptide (TPR) repeat protein
MKHTPQTVPYSAVFKMKNHLAKILLLTLTLYVAIDDLPQAYTTNRSALYTIHLIFNQSSSAEKYKPASFATTTPSLCRTLWLGGLRADHQGNVNRRNQLWTNALRCEPIIVYFLSALHSDNRVLAQHAVEAQPNNSESWFWLAGTHINWQGNRPHTPDEVMREKIIEMYHTGLALDPHDGLRWRELGDLLQPLDPQAAIEAYLQSCFNGDPGWNGCLLAGRTAEQLGDTDSAIRYYSYSRWEGALNRATELEMQQKQTIPAP